jgi:hypothetical protein
MYNLHIARGRLCEMYLARLQQMQQQYQVLSHVFWRLDFYWILIPGNTAMAVFIEPPEYAEQMSISWHYFFLV